MSSLNLLNCYNLVKIDYNAEIWLKSQKVKIHLVKILIKNIVMMLNIAGVAFSKYQLSSDSTRIFFFFKNEKIPQAIEVLKRVFGIQTMSPALRTSHDMKNIIERSLEVCEQVLEQDDTFAIRAKRAGKQEFTSQDVATLVGQAIMDRFSDKKNISVNLSNPKKVIYIEVRGQFAYIHTQIIESIWKGLPIEFHKKIMVMDVGRLDDLLAGFLLMKRGCTISPVLFNLNNNIEEFNARLRNWQEILKYIPFTQLTVIQVDLHDIINTFFKNELTNHYTCAICRLLRLYVFWKFHHDWNEVNPKGFKAISDGLNINNRTECPDYIDLKTLSLNYLFANDPIFTPNIGFTSKEIEQFLTQISKKLQEPNYCAFKPKDQNFDETEIITLYKSLNIEENIKNKMITLNKIVLNQKK